MIDFAILKKFGSTNERLKEVFTAQKPREGEQDHGKGETPHVAGQPRGDEGAFTRKKDWEKREWFQTRIRQRLEEHITFSLKNYHLYAAADLAWDASPVNKATIPLILYAQGKITIEGCATALGNLACRDQFVRKNAAGKEEMINLPKFLEVNANLVRGYVTRRLAAQSNKYNNLYPYYKYEARSTGLTAKLRADALSQRVDMMVDQYGYRHHDVQVMRDMLLYAHSVDFVRASWEVEKQWVRKPVAEGFQEEGKFDVETAVTKEGLAWVNPHPTRVFWDNAHGLASINEDTGCEYIGFWDVRRFGDIHENPVYFNRDSIAYSSNLWGVYSAYQSYFNQYYCQINPPTCDSSLGGVMADPAGNNDRRNQIGLYSGSRKEDSVFYCEYFEKLIPNQHGFGDYPFPVWVRFTVASDNTVIYAEFMPSTPAAYCGYNENDSRQVNISFAHGVMPYQDQMTNLLTQMLFVVEQDLLKIIGINTDVITDPQHLEAIRARFSGQNWAGNPLIIEYSVSKLDELGIKWTEVVKIHETRPSQAIEAIFRAMLQLVNILDKLEAMSPAEQGQPAPREISATEVNEIASTTSSVYSFISDAIDEFRSAKKRIIYESLICCGQSTVRVPVLRRYSRKVVEAAGFQVEEREDEDFSDPTRKRRTVIGSKKLLQHDYIFTSRDGAERSVNTQAANTLVQLLAQVLNVPTVLQALGKEKLYEIVNEIFRLSGTGVDLNLELAEGDDNSLGVDEVKQLSAAMEQLGQLTQQLATVVQQNTQGLAEQEAVNQQQEEALKMVGELAKQVKKMAEKQNQGEERVKLLEDRPPSESISYKDTPSSVRRQMESAAGYVPASESEHRAMQEASKPASNGE